VTCLSVLMHYCCCCCWLSGDDRCLSHCKLRPSVGQVLKPQRHNCVCMCVYMSAQCMCVVSSLYPVDYSLPATPYLPSTTLAIPFHRCMLHHFTSLFSFAIIMSSTLFVAFLFYSYFQSASNLYDCGTMCRLTADGQPLLSFS